MASADTQLEDLRYGDLRTFLAVQRLASVTAAARELSVTPSQVSKAIARLEHQLGIKLMSRSSRGVHLNEHGRRLMPEIEDLVARLRRLRRSESTSGVELTVAGASYLITAALPLFASVHPGVRLRGLEMAPALIRAYAAENFFDLALLGAGKEVLPPSWVSESVGTIRKALFASPKLAKQLGAQPVDEERLRSVPFVCPIYNVAGRWVPSEDDCPLGVSERLQGHEAQTIAVGLELAAHTDQLVFGPVVAAARYLRAGSLVEVRVEGWKVEETLSVVCNTERVLANVRKAILRTMRELLVRIDGE
ncbi:MAG: LysR family transcriptional regulator [Polyangiaceae bacterium]